jgi:L-ascorbate oxidase
VVRSSKKLDPNSAFYDMDLNEHVVVVNDWNHDTIITKYTQFLHDFGNENIDGILINGRGFNVLPARNLLDYETPRSVFHVEKGMRYRFRMINAGVQYCPLQVSVDHHNLTLLAVDGNSIQPVQVTSFYILAGNLFFFISIKV